MANWQKSKNNRIATVEGDGYVYEGYVNGKLVEINRKRIYSVNFRKPSLLSKGTISFNYKNGNIIEKGGAAMCISLSGKQKDDLMLARDLFKDLVEPFGIEIFSDF